MTTLNLAIHSEKCTGCRVCEIVCSIAKESAINPKMSRIRVVTAYPGTVDTLAVCRQCEDAPCVAACPTRAISIDQKTRAVIVDSATCTGCGVCVDECPCGAVIIDEKKNVSVICDLCHGEPECAKWCPFDVIECVDPSSAYKSNPIEFGTASPNK